MITGEITVSTCYGEAVIPVEILDKGPQSGTAWVRALNNLAPFTRMSHGGPYQDSTALWPVSQVRNVQVMDDEEPPTLEVTPLPVEPEPVPGPFKPAEDWFLEMQYEDRTCIE